MLPRHPRVLHRRSGSPRIDILVEDARAPPRFLTSPSRGGRNSPGPDLIRGGRISGGGVASQKRFPPEMPLAFRPPLKGEVGVAPRKKNLQIYPRLQILPYPRVIPARGGRRPEAVHRWSGERRFTDVRSVRGEVRVRTVVTTDGRLEGLNRPLRGSAKIAEPGSSKPPRRVLVKRPHFGLPDRRDISARHPPVRRGETETRPQAPARQDGRGNEGVRP